MLPGPRGALTKLLLGQALAQATVWWTELGMEFPAGSKAEKCADDAGELVDLIVASMAQLEEIEDCMSRVRKR